MGTDRILTQLLGSGAASGFAGGLAGGLASGMLTSKAGRKFGKKALKVGGLAAVGGLAYAAWSRYQQQSGATPPEQDPGAAPFLPSGQTEADALGRVLLQAMIAAAQADGRLDATERHAIERRVAMMDLAPDDRGTLLAQLGKPVDMSVLVAAATTPERAAEIYTASLLAIDVDTPAERAYLAMLAARLGLPQELVDQIHQQVVPAAISQPLAQAAPPA